MTQALAPDPFAPLSSQETTTAASDAVAGTKDLEPITPVPEDAPVAQFHHRDLGDPAAVWTYRDQTGRLLGHVARFNTAAGKQILPRTWCRLPDGSCAWRWRALSAPRPLYGLDRLAARPDASVLIVEGEKTADAAQRHFPDHVAVTWPGGSNAYGKADWSPLAGRRVIVWPDADQSGRKAADEIAKLTTRAGAASVCVVSVPGDLTNGWDLADPVPDNVSLAELLASARAPVPEIELPAGYAMTARGLLWRDPFDDEKPELLLAGQFQVLAETRDGDGKSWGVLLEWLDHDGRRHRLPLPRATLAGDGADARRALLDGGLYVAPSRGMRERFTAFLVAVRSPGRVTATSSNRLARIGVRPPRSVHRRAARGGPAPAGVRSRRACIPRARHARRMAGPSSSIRSWQHQAWGCLVSCVCRLPCRAV